MDNKKINEIHERLSNKVSLYIKLIKEEYGEYIPDWVIIKLNSIKDYKDVVQIFDYGNINCFATDNNINMPLCADKVLEKVSKIPGYGIDKNHRPYNKDNMVINDNTFFTYIKHVYISGTDTEGYYNDVLLHETMHYCGCDGSRVLKEGMNELLTRMLASKYDLVINACGYPKEVKLTYYLMELFTEETVKTIAFMKNFDEEKEYIESVCGKQAGILYEKVTNMAEKEFQEKYYSHLEKFNGISGIFKKIMYYKKIDYSNIYKVLDDYVKRNGVNYESSNSKMR